LAAVSCGVVTFAVVSPRWTFLRQVAILKHTYCDCHDIFCLGKLCERLLDDIDAERSEMSCETPVVLLGGKLGELD